MSIWVRTFATRAIGPLDAESMRAGIASRLTLLTYLLCPDEEEEPENVLARLRVHQISEDTLNIFYRVDEHFIRVDRWAGGQAEREVQEFLAEILRPTDPGVDTVKEILSKCVETVAFELKLSDARGMGWPLAVGGAAHLAQTGNGIIYADDVGWMVPSGKEVKILVPG